MYNLNDKDTQPYVARRKKKIRASERVLIRRMTECFTYIELFE